MRDYYYNGSIKMYDEDYKCIACDSFYVLYININEWRWSWGEHAYISKLRK